MKCTAVIELHPENDLLAFKVIGIVNVLRDEHPLKAPSPRDVTESGIVIEFKEQLYAAYAEIVVTVCGIEKVVTSDGMW